MSKDYGLVIACHGHNLEVEAANGAIVACSKRQNLSPIVPGDQVSWQPAGEKQGVVTAIEQRKTLISRPDARGKLHAVAANVDQMFVVIAPVPAPQLTTIDRYLVAATIERIKPILVLNKDDLLDSVENTEELRKNFDYYKKIGIDTIYLSTKAQHNLDLLNAELINKTSIFVGQSGVGKSSIIANLLPNESVKVGAISDNIHQGRHTTTTARLYHLKDVPGSIIDSPGIREFPLWPLEPRELAQGFSEFVPLLHDCKFRNCTHINELGCALIAAVNQGKISTTRLISYQKILEAMRG